MNRTEQMKMAAYEAPTVEVIEVAVEKGFAITGHADDSVDSEFGV